MRGGLMLGILLVAFWLRACQSSESLWLDELHTAWVVADGLRPLPRRAALGNYSPVYFGLVWAATQLAGFDEFGLRLCSILAGTALVGGVYLVAARWTSCWQAGLLAALLVAVDRHCVFYGQEARPYALVQLVGLVNIGLFARASARPSALSRGLWIATAVLLFYLHYTAALLLAAELAYIGAIWLARFRPAWTGHGGRPQGHAPVDAGTDRARAACPWRWGWIDGLVVGVCVLPALPHLRQIALRRADWSLFVPERTWWKVWEIGNVFPLGMYVLTPVTVLAIAWGCTWLCRARRGMATTRPRMNGSGLLLVACWLLVPAMIAWVATSQATTPLFFRRYLIVSAVTPILVAAWCAAACPSVGWRAALATTVLGLSIYQGGMVGRWRQDGRVLGDRAQDWRGAVAHVRDQSRPEQPVFVRSGLIEAERWYASEDLDQREYCLLPVLGLYRLEQSTNALFPLPIRPAAILAPEAIRRAKASGQAWFVVQGSARSATRFEADLRSAWRRAGLGIASIRRASFQNVTTFHVELGAATGVRSPPLAGVNSRRSDPPDRSR